GDAKSYTDDKPPMILASMRGPPGPVARIGSTSLELVEVPAAIEPPHGGFVVVLEADPSGPHAACDLVRVPKGAKLSGTGIARALVFASDAAEADAAPASWREQPKAPFAAFEDGEPGKLPFEEHGLRVEEASPSAVKLTIGERSTEAPRYWL